MVLARATDRLHADAAQEQPVEIAEQRPVAGEGRGCSRRRPTAPSTSTAQSEALRHGGEHVLLAHHAAIEQRQARDASSSAPAGRRRSSRRCRRHRSWRRGFARAPAKPHSSASAMQRRATLLSCPPWMRVVALVMRSSRRHARMRLRTRCSERVGVGLAGADAHGLIDRRDEDLAVADLAGLGGVGDGFDHLVDPIGRRPRPRCRSSAGNSRRIRRRGRSPCGPSGGRSL